MKFGSLFSGIGGLDLGLERAGMKCAWQVEIDDYANKVLEKHWPGVPRFRDIRECGSGNLEPVDLIAGGFPCQDVSLAGARAGITGKRSGLWKEYARIIRELRPRIVLVENVPGLLSGGMGEVLGDLSSLGFDAEWESLPASAFGAPHRRDRIFMVAYADRGRELQSEGVFPDEWRWTCDGNWWARKPGICPVAYGVSGWVDMLRCFALAVVPQVAEYVGKRIMEWTSSR